MILSCKLCIMVREGRRGMIQVTARTFGTSRNVKLHATHDTNKELPIQLVSFTFLAIPLENV